MFRLLVWIILISIAIWLWRRLKGKTTQPNATPEANLPMVRCQQCGVFIPQTQAIQAGNDWYCSRAHQEQHCKHLNE